MLFFLAFLAVGSSGCQRLAVVGCVGWQMGVAVVGGCDSR